MSATEGTVLQTIAWQRVGDVLLLCVGEPHSSDHDVARWIERLGQLDFRVLLIFSQGGGGLSSRQRRQIVDFWRRVQREAPRCALLTDSQVSRYVLTALSWLVGGGARAFDLEDWRGALAWIGAEGERRALKQAVSRLQTGLTFAQTGGSKFRSG